MKSFNWLRLGSWLGRFLAALTIVWGCTTPASAQLLDEKALFNWAEVQFPAIFPGPQADMQGGGFVYRYYPSTQNAVGVSDGLVYALGPATSQQLQVIDTVASFQCLVYPQRCASASVEAGVAALHYGRNTIITLAGSALEQVGTTLSISNNCSNPRAIATLGGAQIRSVSCTVVGTGNLAIAVSNASGAVLMTRTFTIPEPQVLLQTNLGNVLVQLNPTAAPVTVNNFLNYVKSGYYTNTLFHRVIPGFMAQGGGFAAGPTPKTPTYAPIVLESNKGLSNLRGTIAMARTSVADSATSQFFINLVDNAFLNYTSATSPGYAVFGTVLDGMAVVDQMAAIPTGSVNGMLNVPLQDVVILSAVQVQ